MASAAAEHQPRSSGNFATYCESFGTSSDGVKARGATRASGGGGTATATASSATVLATPIADSATSLRTTSTAMRVVASLPSSERRSSGDQRT